LHGGVLTKENVGRQGLLESSGALQIPGELKSPLSRRREIGKRLSSYIEGRELIPDAKVTALIYDTIREGEARKRPLK